VDIDVDRLLFRRQFVLTTKSPVNLNGWHSIKISNRLTLYVHPDLPLAQTKCNEKTLLLLGNILDPHNPKFSNQQILEELAKGLGGFDELVSATDEYGGRWALIFCAGSSIKIFHDACGLRQIYYIAQGDSVWCGSQPEILRHLNPEIGVDPDALEVTQSPNYAREENAWVGNKTIYNGIRHLLPNHCLNLKDGSVRRYWPLSPIQKTPVTREHIEILCRYISGSLEAAANRFGLMIPVTAGWDSRVLLAASKSVSKDVFYYISTGNSMPADHQDITVPARLLKKLGLAFNIVDPDPEQDSRYIQLYLNNVTAARNLPKSVTIHHMFKHCQGKVNISGNGAEIARSFFRSHAKDQQDVRADNLAAFLGYPDVEYVVNELASWLTECAPICSQCGLEVLDLLYWEQRMGNWGSMYQSEQDIAIEEIWPFNNRALLAKMLSVDVTYRIAPQYKLFKMLMARMWPAVLSEPINPAFHVSAVRRLRSAIGRRIPIVRSLYRLIRNRVAGTSSS